MSDEVDDGISLDEKSPSSSNKVNRMDSFEKIEAEILQEDVKNRSKLSGFSEEYRSMEEETTFDQQIAAARGLQKQEHLDELTALDLQWKMERESELAEKALERLEVAALIKKAEQKLLPQDEHREASQDLPDEVLTEIAQETEELSPELAMLDGIISSADLLRMESSDLSEEEGFRLRLSCILEESESDTGSASGMLKIRGKELPKISVEPKLIASLETENEQMAENKTKELAEQASVKQDEQFETDILDSALDVSQVLDHVEEKNADQEKPPIEEEDMLDSVESSSPEPNFGIQRMKSGTKVNKFTTSPVLKKRIDSSSESSLDLSTPSAASPSTEDANKSLDTMKPDIEIEEPSSPADQSIDSNKDLSIHTCSARGDISKSATPENMQVEMANSNEAIARENSAYNIQEVTDEEVQAMFPKVQVRARGKSEEKEVRTRSDSQSIKSFDIRGAAARVRALFPKIKSRRGKSLDSGMAEKQRQEDERKQAEAKSQERQQKGTSEPPPVPPETYLWEELRRWRIKGGYPWTHLDKPPFDEKTWKNQTHFAGSVGRLLTSSARPGLVGSMRRARSRSSAAERERGKRSSSRTGPRNEDGSRVESRDRSRSERSRDSSASSGREVRCACQFFMSDDPLPERKSLFGSRTPSRSPDISKMAKIVGDHEYEPINPPPLESTEKPNETVEGNESKGVDFNDTHFLRIPRDDELVVSPEDMEVEAIGAARQFQDDLEERFLATPMTATTASRTDCDVNTSMLDSSGLEDLPLKRGARTKKVLQTKTEQMRAQAQGLQQRIRSQAGKLRNKLRSIPRPNFAKRQDRRGDEEKEERAPRFKLPERPKFNMPDRSKFKMPQRPKIVLQNLAKPLRERQARLTADGKKNFFDIDFKTYPRMFDKRAKARSDYATSSPKMPRSATPPPAPMQPARKKGPVGQRWVNRFDDIKFVDDRGSQMSHPSGRSDQSESLSGFHDRDFAIADDFDHAQLPPPRAVSSIKSSVSRGSELEPQSSRSSVDRHGQGVLEEIDPDQFFLRQKGISENDINMEKYLSEEIREAFRSPVVNALRQLDVDYEEPVNSAPIVQNEVKESQPLAPTRTRSLKRGEKVPSQDGEKAEEVPTEHIKARYENLENTGEEAKPRYANQEEDNPSEYYKSPPSPREYQHYKVPRPTPIKRKSNSTEKAGSKKQNGWVEVEIETELEEIPLEEVPQTLPRRKSKKSVEPKQFSAEEPEPDYIVPETEPPQAPKRTRSLHSLAQEVEQAPIAPKRTSSKSIHSIGLSKDPDTKSLHSAYEERRGATVPRRIRNLSKGSRSVQSLSNAEVPEQAPLAPERTRSLSRASRGSHSYLADDEKSWVPQAPDRTRSMSRKSAARQPKKTEPSNEEPVITKTEVQVNHYEAPTESGFDDYAVIEKVKPPRPPAPRRRKGSRSPTFNTFPRRSPSGSGPVRPVRNYATLGPSRPERRTKKKPAARSLEHIYSSDQMSQSYLQVEDALQTTEDIHGSNKDLQASEVVEKMKARPLPAPPRPPRLKAKSEEQSMEIVEEVCVSTQTDPLPDDVCLEEDIIQEFSHEQLKIQEAFLQEMRDEEERIKREIESKRKRHIDVTAESEENAAKMEIIRQMDDLIREERRLLDDERRFGVRISPIDDKKAELTVLDDDMGYASLDRRQTRIEDEPQPSTSFQQSQPPVASSSTRVVATASTEVVASSSSQDTTPLTGVIAPSVPPEQPAQIQEPAPLVPAQNSQPPVYFPLVPEIVSTDRLRVGQLEVERLTVGTIDSTNLAVQNLSTQTVETTELRSNSMQVQNISSHSGNLAIKNLELPPEFIQQLIDRIPWEQLRPPQQPVATGPTPRTPSVDEDITSSSVGDTRRRSRHVRHTHSRSRTHDSSEEEPESRISLRRPTRSSLPQEAGIGELSQNLAQACTSATVRALRSFSEVVRPPPVGEERIRYVQAVLLVALVAIVGYFLINFTGRATHHHHWDFQFPPQPPTRQ